MPSIFLLGYSSDPRWEKGTADKNRRLPLHAARPAFSYSERAASDFAVVYLRLLQSQKKLTSGEGFNSALAFSTCTAAVNPLVGVTFQDCVLLQLVQRGSMLGENQHPLILYKESSNMVLSDY